jgi:hypothetical protein
MLTGVVMATVIPVNGTRKTTFKKEDVKNLD